MVIAGFIISTFVGFGLYEWSGASRFDTVAEVNGEKIPNRRFQAQFNQAVTMKRNESQELTADALKGMKQEVIQGLVQESVFHQEAGRYGFRVSDEELAGSLRAYPAFQKDGKYDPNAYSQTMQRIINARSKEEFIAGLQEFEESQRRQLTIHHLRNFVMRSVKITDRELDLEMFIRQAKAAGDKKAKPLERETVRNEMLQEKGAHILNRWYQQLGTNVKFKIYLDENKG